MKVSKKNNITEFTIPVRLPSANTFERMHWAEKYRLKNEMRILIMYIFKKKKIKYKNVDYIEIELSFSQKRRRDKMNYITPADKLIIDNLVELGIIPDDSQLEIPSIIFTNKKEDGVLVRIAGV